MLLIVTPADLSQMVVNAGSETRMKNGPGKPGPLIQIICARTVRLVRLANRNAVFSGSKPEIGQVAVADGNAAAGDQQAVDGSHQPAEQRAGGKEAD